QHPLRHTILPYTTLFRSKRTEDFCTCSSQSSVASKPYFSLSCLRGGLLNSHMPSSAWSGGKRADIKRLAVARSNQRVGFRFIKRDRKSTRLNSSHRTSSY